MLSEKQKEQFWRDGYLVVENAVDKDVLQANYLAVAQR